MDLSSQISKIQTVERLDNADLTLLNPSSTSNIAYGEYTPISGEIVELHVYDDADNYIKSVDNLVGNSDFTNLSFHWSGSVNDASGAKIRMTDIPAYDHLNTLGFLNGTYSAVYNFLKKYIYTSEQIDWYLDEISTSRREVRLLPVSSSLNIGQLLGDTLFDGTPNADGLTASVDRIKQLNPEVRFLLDFGKNQISVVVNQAIDAETNSLVLRLYKPLPDNIVEKQPAMPVAEFARPVKLTLTLSVDPGEEQPFVILAGPNRHIDVSKRSNAQSVYKSWTDILSTNAITSQNLIDYYISSSNYNQPINVDYTDYSNFIHFSSAEERVNNFYYKLQLLEQYSASYATISGSSSGYVVSGAISLFNLQHQILNGFDGYEKWLYYTSGSIFSSSLGYGSVTQSTWSKTNSTYPYTLALTTSPQGQSWYTQEVQRAQDYDSQNKDSLIVASPFHINEDDNNASYLLFLNMVGQHFDSIWTYIKYFTQKNDLQNKLTDGSSKDLSWDILKSYGFDLVNGNDTTALWKYAFGTDVTGSYQNNLFQYSMNDATKEIWKRILNNLPYLLKTKGTSRGIRALISCYGIPSTMLRIREYGGPDPDANSEDTQYISDIFTYALKLSSPAWVSGSWGTFNGKHADAIEFRFATSASQYTTMSLFETKDNVGLPYLNIQLVASSSLYPSVGGYVKFTLTSGSHVTSSVTSELPIYNNSYWSVLFQRSSGSDSTVDQTHTLYVKSGDSGRLTFQSSASIFSAYNTHFAYSWKGGTSFAIGSGSTPNTFNGTIQEFRLWNSALYESVFNNHVLAPTAYNGNSYSSSYTDLVLRYRFNNSNFYSASGGSYIITGSGTYVLDTNPLQTSINNGIVQNTANALFTAQSETNYFKIPNTGNLRFTSNKVRVDTVISMSGDLNTKRRVTKNKYDTSPVDTNKVGIYLSPTDLINEDIIRTFTDFSIDNFIGNPNDELKWNYPDLEVANKVYWSKYSTPPNIFTYLRALSYFDRSLFTQLRNFIPARANAQLGYIIEPHALERAKALPQTNVIFSNTSYYEGEIDLQTIESSSALYNTIQDMTNNVSLLLISSSTGRCDSYMSQSILNVVPALGLASLYSYPIVIQSMSISNNTLTITSGSFTWDATQSQIYPASDFWFDVSSYTPVTSSITHAVIGYSGSHWIYHNDYTKGRKNLFYDGCLQTLNTTTDKRLPFEGVDVPFTKMTVVDTGADRPRLKVQ